MPRTYGFYHPETPGYFIGSWKLLSIMGKDAQSPIAGAAVVTSLSKDRKNVPMNNDAWHYPLPSETEIIMLERYFAK